MIPVTLQDLFPGSLFKWNHDGEHDRQGGNLCFVVSRSNMTFDQGRKWIKIRYFNSHLNELIPLVWWHDKPLGMTLLNK